MGRKPQTAPVGAGADCTGDPVPLIESLRKFCGVEIPRFECDDRNGASACSVSPQFEPAYLLQSLHQGNAQFASAFLDRVLADAGKKIDRGAETLDGRVVALSQSLEDRS